MFFKDPIAPKEDNKYIDRKKVISPFAKEPTYDSAKRMFDAGCTYGVGFKQPVGKEKARGVEAGPVPQKSKAVDPDVYA